MKHSTRVATTAAITTVLGGAVILGATAPSWAETVTIRPGDFITGLSDTRAEGEVEFLADGLHVTTGANTATDPEPYNNKAAEYWERNGALPNSASLTWNGTANRPAVQLVFDTDDDRDNAGSVNILVGNLADAENFWYVGGQTRAADRGIACPSTAAGSGSDCHGTLAQWKGSLADEQLYAVGFALDGVEGDGVIRSVTVGPDTYRFTSNPPPGPDPVVTDVTGHADAFKRAARRKAIVQMSTDSLGPNQVEGERARFRIYVDGKKVFTATKGEGTSARWVEKFRRHTGKHVVTVTINGFLEDRVRVATGKPRRR